jgi:hypothetical protein
MDLDVFALLDLKARVVKRIPMIALQSHAITMALVWITRMDSRANVLLVLLAQHVKQISMIVWLLLVIMDL